MGPLRREQIVRATIRCLARDGYAGLTMKRVAAEAAVSPGILHYYFRDKAAMLAAAALRVTADLDRRVAVQTRGARTARARLRAVIRSCLETAVESRDFWTVFIEFWGEALHDRRLAAVNRQAYARARRLIGAALARGRAGSPRRYSPATSHPETRHDHDPRAGEGEDVPPGEGHAGPGRADPRARGRGVRRDGHPSGERHGSPGPACAGRGRVEHPRDPGSPGGDASARPRGDARAAREPPLPGEPDPGRPSVGRGHGPTVGRPPRWATPHPRRGARRPRHRARPADRGPRAGRHGDQHPGRRRPGNAAPLERGVRLEGLRGDLPAPRAGSPEPDPEGAPGDLTRRIKLWT